MSPSPPDPAKYIKDNGFAIRWTKLIKNSISIVIVAGSTAAVAIVTAPARAFVRLTNGLSEFISELITTVITGPREFSGTVSKAAAADLQGLSPVQYLVGLVVVLLVAMAVDWGVAQIA